MEQHEIEAHIKNIDNRTERIEQILPTLPTKEDLREEGERTRRHFDIVAEEIRASVEKIAEGHGVLGTRIEGLRAELKTELDKHERRIARLEVERRRK